MAELTGKIEYPGLRRQITANGDDPRVSYGRLSGPRNASGFRYPSQAVITVDGHGTYPINANTGAYIWQGSQAATDTAALYQMDLTAKRWRLFYLPGASRLYACPEQDYAALAAANDVLRVEYQTQAGMWRRSQMKLRPCIPLAARMQILAGTVASGDAVGDDSTVRFLNPGKMAINPTDGALFVIDAGNHKIKRRDFGTGIWTTFLTDSHLIAPIAGGGGTGSPGSGLCFAANGDLYYNHSTTTFPTNIIVKVPHGSSSGSAVVTSGVHMNAAANVGGGMAVSLDQSALYICDATFFGVSQIFSLDLSSGVVSVYAGAGGFGIPSFSVFGVYYDATLNSSRLTAVIPSPADVYVDPIGRVITISGDLGGLSRINLDGSVTRLTGSSSYVVGGGDLPTFGDTGSNYFGDGLPATNQYRNTMNNAPAGSFVNAVSFCVSDCFDMVVADIDDKVVRTIGADGNIYTLAGGPRINRLAADPQALIAPTTGTGASITSPILSAGVPVDANAYGLPGKPQAVCARPRGQGGGVFVSLVSTAHCILLLS